MVQVRWSRRILLAVVAITFGVVPLGTPALANEDCTDQPGSPFCPESAFQRYWWSASLTGGWLTAASNSRIQDIEPTEMDTVVRANHDDSDVAVYTYNQDDGFYGVAGCPDQSGNICLHWHVSFNKFDFPGDGESTPYSTAHMNRETCHEFGHATGLWHQPNDTGDSCMSTGHFHVGVFDSHDLFHVTRILT